jgi:hypothetical protein
MDVMNKTSKAKIYPKTTKSTDENIRFAYKPSPEIRDSMGNPEGYSHKKTFVPDGGGKPFPSFKEDKMSPKDIKKTAITRRSNQCK